MAQMEFMKLIEPTIDGGIDIHGADLSDEIDGISETK